MMRFAVRMALVWAGHCSLFQNYDDRLLCWLTFMIILLLRSGRNKQLKLFVNTCFLIWNVPQILYYSEDYYPENVSRTKTIKCKLL